MKLSEIALVVDGIATGPEVICQNVAIDSRQLLKGALFIALKGHQFNGHQFIRQAQEKGACAAIVSESVSSELPIIKVKDTREALGKLATHHRQKFSIPVIALTGSVGKTSTKSMLESILSQCGPVLANIKSFNNDIGVPLTLLQLADNHRYAVIEMGANHAGEIAYLSELAKPDIALITNIGPAHLEGFGSIEGVAAAKAELFTSLKLEGIGVVNADDRFVNYLRKQLGEHETISFGCLAKADVSAQQVKQDEKGCLSFQLVTPQGKIFVQLNVLGEHNLFNALAAVAAVQPLNLPLIAIKKGLEHVSPVQGRLVRIQGKRGNSIIDDTYNANPSSVEAALIVLAQTESERWFVFGGMSELGKESTHFHRELGVLAKKLGIQRVYTCGNLAQFTSEGFGKNAEHFSTQAELIDKLKKNLASKVTILIKGSRSTHMENVVEALVD